MAIRAHAGAIAEARMKAAHTSMVSTCSLRWLLASGLVASLGAAACNGDIGGVQATGPNGGGNTPGVLGPGSHPAAGIDPGRVAIHRLNNTEYNNTVRDLLGTATQPAAMFLAEEGLQFDNTATALGMTISQYEGYLKAAADLMAESLANPAQKSRFMSCTPAAAGDPCARQIIETFGMKIYRRPLDAAEVTRAMKVYDDDFARAKNGT